VLALIGQFVVFAFVLLATESWCWQHFSDVFVLFYLFLAELMLAARICGWPRAGWLGANRLEEVRRLWSGRIFGKTYHTNDRIRSIEDNNQVRNMFAARLHHDQTETLCHAINDDLNWKIAVYCLAFLLFLFVDSNKTDQELKLIGGDLMETLAKFVLTAVVSILPLIWIFSRCEMQRFLNKEVHKPTR
jgi:hypothetical protein